MPEFDLQRLILILPPILLALTCHEFAHGYVAFRLGDPTAKMLGRLTLNPIKHLDPIGTLALIITQMFGWAKPVPVNPRYFKNPSKDMMLVAIAGPLTNLFLAAVCAIVFKIIIAMNIPITPVTETVLKPLVIMIKFSIIINVALAVFNMLPVPPLDGSKVMMHFLPPEMAFKVSRYEQYGFVILIFLLFTGIAWAVIGPIINFILGFLL